MNKPKIILDDANYFDPEEEVPIIPDPTKVPPLVQVKNGEENEEILLKMNAKLKRFRDGEWKQRGKGYFKILKHKDTKRVRFVFREGGTLKGRANFIIDNDPLCILEENPTSPCRFTFSAKDTSDGNSSEERFKIKFESIQDKEQFKEVFLQAKSNNNNLLNENETKTDEKTDDNQSNNV